MHIDRVVFARGVSFSLDFDVPPTEVEFCVPGRDAFDPLTRYILTNMHWYSGLIQLQIMIVLLFLFNTVFIRSMLPLKSH